MATLNEVFDLFNNSTLRNKIAAACIIAAEAIRVEDAETDNHANRRIWATRVFGNPRSVSDTMMLAVIAANAGQSAVNILGASDSAIQTNVNEAVNLFATGV